MIEVRINAGYEFHGTANLELFLDTLPVSALKRLAAFRFSSRPRERDDATNAAFCKLFPLLGKWFGTQTVYPEVAEFCHDKTIRDYSFAFDLHEVRDYAIHILGKRIAVRAVDTLLGETDLEPSDFMQNYSKAWHCQLRYGKTGREDDWMEVQWYRGVEKIGDWSQVATGDGKLWAAWMTKYLTWLDQCYPFDKYATSGIYSIKGINVSDGPNVGEWTEDACRHGFLDKYRKTPNGRRLPPAPRRRK